MAREKKRTERIEFRVTPDEKRLIEYIASQTRGDITISDLIRISVLNPALRRKIDEYIDDKFK